MFTIDFGIGGLWTSIKGLSWSSTIEYLNLWASSVPYYVSTAVLYAPTILAYGLPAVGAVYFMSVIMANYNYAVTTRSPYPLYGERHQFEHIPTSNVGSEAVHKLAKNFSYHREQFLNAAGDINMSTRTIGLVNKDGITGFNLVEPAAPYGIFVPVALASAVLLCVVFTLLLVIFSSKMRWSDFRDATSQYECGAEQVYIHMSPHTTVSFFRLLVVFLIFELEVAVLFLAFPLITLLTPQSIYILTIFIVLIQIAALIEIRAGAVRWLRSMPVFVVIPFSNQSIGQIFQEVYLAISMLVDIEIFVVVVFLMILFFRVDAVSGVVRSSIHGLRLLPCRLPDDTAAVICALALPLLAAIPLKLPDVFVFLASDLELDRKLAK
jgi:NADH:ubiquinone oxidoreductase subunit 3 (subunit A)